MVQVKKIKKGIAPPSAAYSVKPGVLKYYAETDKTPEMDDVIYGRVSRIGEHSSLENKSGRIHMIHNGSLGVFVFGNRYAPDYYEGIVPEKFKERKFKEDVDLLARSGVVGVVQTKNTLRKDPTRIKVLGYVCGANGNIVTPGNSS